jgi:V8-like Glu-specific endopeptidase
VSDVVTVQEVLTPVTVTEVATPVTVAEVTETVRVADDGVSVVSVGIPGPPGPSGSGDLHYTHHQAVAASTWVILHGLGKFPSVSVADSAGSWWVADVRYDSVDQVTLTFGSPFSGVCYLN